MREMKDSGIPWIGEIPKDWKISPIKYICKPNSIKIGPFGSALANKTFANEKYNVYGQANLVSGNFSATKNTVTKKTFNDLRNYEVLPDDICVSMMGTIGKCRIVPLGIKQGIMDSHLIKLRVENAVMLPEFFLYVYDKDLGGVCFKQMQYEKTGSIMDGLNTSIVKRLYVTLPPVKEQHRITIYLDSKCAKIDSIKKNVETEIEALKQYKQSVITEAVTKGLNKNVEMKDSGIPWIGKIPKHWKIHPVYFYFNARKHRNSLGKEKNLLSLSYGEIIEKDINKIGGLLPESFNTYNIVESGDIIIRPTDLQNDKRSLRTGLVKEHGIITSAYIDLMSIRPVNTVYYHYLLHTYDVMKVFYNMGNGVRQGLNFSEFSHLMLFEPTVEEQQQIADYLDTKCSKIDSIIHKKQELLTKLDTYKKSLIYEYVTGKKEVPAV